MSDPSILPATSRDLTALTALYNHYVRESAATFDVEPYTVAERRAWFTGFAGRGPHRLLVARAGDALLGYASSGRFRPKDAYDPTVEVSVYLAPEAMGSGLGTRLYTALFAQLADELVHRAVAGITLPNDASIALHRGFGFEPVGTFREVGFKLGRYWDVQWWQKPLGEPSS